MKFSPQSFFVSLAFVLGLNACATTFYVNVANPSPAAPFTNWLAAATSIQDAIDASSDGDWVLVTNGVYNTGGRVVYGSLTNRVVINKAVTVQSVNGPSVTVIQGNPVIGSSAVRCVYLTNNAVISGFTLTNGATLNNGDGYQEQSGGGLICCVNTIATNCILAHNSAIFLGGGAFGYGSSFSNVCGTLTQCSIIQNNSLNDGGGVFGVNVTSSLLSSNVAGLNGGGAGEAVLTNCIIMQNVATNMAGGTYWGSLYGCLVISNYSNADGGVTLSAGGSAINCTIIANNANGLAGGIDALGNAVKNCIVYYNNVTTGSSSNYSGGGFFQHCCTQPSPGISYLNITNEPGFVDYANGNYHLQSNSPCINGGLDHTVAPFPTDLDGNPRMVDQIVDIGAYEYQIAASILPIYWAQQYGLSRDGTIDSDGDGMNNFQEFIAGTNPTNAASVLKMLSVSNSLSGTTVKWQCGSFVNQYLQRSTNLAGQPVFSSIRSNLSTFGTTLSFKDTNAVGAGPFFYRVGVQ